MGHKGNTFFQTYCEFSVLLGVCMVVGLFVVVVVIVVVTEIIVIFVVACIFRHFFLHSQNDCA